MFTQIDLTGDRFRSSLRPQAFIVWADCTYKVSKLHDRIWCQGY